MRGMGAQSKRIELKHTDVEALTDVSGTDARFAQACAAAWMCTRVSSRFCAQYLCAYIAACTVHVLVFAGLIFCVCGYMKNFSTSYLSISDSWLLSYNKEQDDSN